MAKHLKDVEVNTYGQAILDSTDLIELLLQGKPIDYFSVIESDPDIQKFRSKHTDLLDDEVVLLGPPSESLSFDEFHEQASNTWTFPKGYQDLDVKAWLLLKCRTDVERDRVLHELSLFEKKDMMMILRLFIFLVDYMRQNKFIWGVGRGSAVASYVLYLIGVHRVNSIKYNLDITEFLR